MMHPLNDILTFLDRGGSILFIIFLVSLIFWTLFAEKYLYFKFVYKPKSKKLKKFWKHRNNGNSWENMQLKQAQVSELNLQLNANIPTMKMIITLFPLLGLLGTVTGMVSVFDSMSSLGTNAKAMAGGISMATIPTMAGMLLAVLSIFAFSRINFMIKTNIRRLKDNLLKDSDA